MDLATKILPGIDAEGRRGIVPAFLTLFGITAALTILETARDALFLTSLPAEHLPFAYLAIAAISLPLAYGRWGGVRLGLTPVLVGAAAITVGLWFVIGADEISLHGLYVWTGLYATMAISRFWMLIDGRYTMAEAKRAYALVGAGGMLGAVAGSVLARLLAESFAPRTLLLGAAAVLAGSAVMSLWLGGRSAESTAGRPGPMRSVIARIAREPYLAKVATLILLSSATLTLLDFLFKSVVAASVPAHRLAPFFADINIVLNVLSVVSQLVLVGWLLRTTTLPRMLLVLPALLVLGAAGVVATLSLLMACLVKGADGALRHSLHRSVIELLYVPLPDRLREATKPFIDAAGQRLGQALASLLIVALVWAGVSLQVMAGILTAGAAAWLVVSIRFRAPYLELFRTALREGTIQGGLDLPRLDLAAVETLIAGLSSPRDAEVLTALALLEAQRKDRLVPGLILYHPSPAVLLRAIELFATGRRRDLVPLFDRVLEHPDAEVRAAVLRVRTALVPSPELVRARLDDPSPVVRATARVVACRLDGEDAAICLAPVLDSDDADARRALARAIRQQPHPTFAAALLALGRDADDQVRLEAAAAMAVMPDVRFLPALIDMLAVRPLKAEARAALLAIGRPALEHLDRALGDARLPSAVRMNLPRCIGAFASPNAGAILLEHLLGTSEGIVRFQILRALGRMRVEHPRLPLAVDKLDQALAQTVAGVYRLLDWRCALESDPLPAAHDELLRSALADKERHGVERLFRLLNLRFSVEDFEPIYLGLRNPDRNVQAGSLELIGNALEPPLREAVLGLVEDLPGPQRLGRCGPYYTARGQKREEVLEAILDQGGETLRALAVYQIALLGLDHLRDRVAALRGTGRFLPQVVARALEVMKPAPSRGAKDAR